MRRSTARWSRETWPDAPWPPVPSARGRARWRSAGRRLRPPPPCEDTTRGRSARNRRECARAWLHRRSRPRAVRYASQPDPETAPPAAPGCSDCRHPWPTTWSPRLAAAAHALLKIVRHRAVGVVRQYDRVDRGPQPARPDTGGRVAEIAARNHERGRLAVQAPDRKARGPVVRRLRQQPAKIDAVGRGQLEAAAQCPYRTSAALTIRWQSSKRPRTARLATLPPQQVSCRSCVGDTRPFGYSTATSMPLWPWKAAATAPPVSPEVATRIFSGRMAPRRSARQHRSQKPRAEVLERGGGPWNSSSTCRRP